MIRPNPCGVKNVSYMEFIRSEIEGRERRHTGDSLYVDSRRIQRNIKRETVSSSCFPRGTVESIFNDNVRCGLEKSIFERRKRERK